MTKINLEFIDNAGISSCKGFSATGIAAGLKKGRALDLAMVYSELPCQSAGVFTTNAFRAAPVIYDEQVLKSGAPVHGIIINSGCANACTGDRGLVDTREMATTAEKSLNAPKGSFYVMSTGVIGQHLPMDLIKRGIASATNTLGNSQECASHAARAIMTTDTRPKEIAVRVQTEQGHFFVGGIAKGSGMIHPNMATMLCAIVTDAAISGSLLQNMLSQVVDTSFNMITVDGDTSTNDTVLVLANGAADLPFIDTADHLLYDAVLEALDQVLTHLAREIVRDGEGAEHAVEISVKGATSRKDARRVARAVANSSLVKTAIYGQDANWGRVICAVGYSGAKVKPECVSLKLEDMLLFKNGTPVPFDESEASEILGQPQVRFEVDLGIGEHTATMWTCDLTHEYVNINAHYRT